jgi:outer membrane protein TolC
MIHDALLVQAQLSQVNIQIRRLTASVLLVKALGGGWQNNGRPELEAGGAHVSAEIY